MAFTTLECAVRMSAGDLGEIALLLRPRETTAPRIRGPATLSSVACEAVNPSERTVKLGKRDRHRREHRGQRVEGDAAFRPPEATDVG
jgi:hypothetical protein